jgi:hypothetical protein
MAVMVVSRGHVAQHFQVFTEGSGLPKTAPGELGDSAPPDRQNCTHLVDSSRLPECRQVYK